MITPKKTVSFTWSIFWLLIKSWIVWFAHFWDGLNAMNLVFFKFNESLLTLICCRCFAFFLLHGRLILLLYVPFLYYIYCKKKKIVFHGTWNLRACFLWCYKKLSGLVWTLPKWLVKEKSGKEILSGILVACLLMLQEWHTWLLLWLFYFF